MSLHARLAHNIIKKQALSVISFYECYVFLRPDGSFYTATYPVLGVVWCRQKKKAVLIVSLMACLRYYIAMYGIVKFCAGAVIGFGVKYLNTLSARLNYDNGV